ncbi:MAG TPA: hypothetical protein VNE62_06945, partial [Actinomycetota bacterium]|nr:hypothetical protein [Actinomycetota bacterium]
QLLWRALDDLEDVSRLDCHFARLVEAGDLDAQLARAWTIVRCVDYWLWGLGVGLTHDPVKCETIIDWAG